MIKKVFPVVLVLLLVCFIVNETESFASATNQDDTPREESSEIMLNNDDYSTNCLTCGGTYTENYVVVDSHFEYGPWAIDQPILGGVHGGNVSVSKSIAYTTSVTSGTNYTVGKLNAATGFSVGRTIEKTITQTFNTQKNGKYYLKKRPVYQVKKVRYSVYTYTTGGRKQNLGYKYSTVKQLNSVQLNLVKQ